MIVGAFSERLYKDELEPDVVNKFHEILIECNNAKHYAYSVLMRGKNVAVGSKSGDIINTTTIRNRYGMNTYYANMAIRSAKAARNSNIKLKDSQIEDLQQQIENRELKITKNTESMKHKTELLGEFTHHLPLCA